MNIYVDESGTFTQSNSPGAWCVVTAYVAPEHSRRAIGELMSAIRSRNGGGETKLKHLKEEEYIQFLRQLAQLDGVAFAVATDLGLETRASIERHRDKQAGKIDENHDRMIYESGRQMVLEQSARLRSLPAQLYLQMVCQFMLFQRVINLGSLYFVQRYPPAIGNFRWRLDRKDREPKAYENAFKDLLPAMLQTKTFAQPMITLTGANYSHFNKFVYAEGEIPSYLQSEFGIVCERAANIGKIINDDFKLVDSASSPGVQVADLLAGGLRRLLRGGFSSSSNRQVAALMGAIFLKPGRGQTAIQFVTLDEAARISKDTSALIRIFDAATRSMMTK